MSTELALYAALLGDIKARIRMLAFYRECPDLDREFSPLPVAKMPEYFGQLPVAQLPWAHMRGMDKPIGVSEYELTRALPDSLKSSLPTIEAIEAELRNELEVANNEA